MLKATTATERSAGPRRLSGLRSIEWLGQTAASLLWIGSVLAYGITTAGDWLQLTAASAWLVANVATVVKPVQERN